VEIGGVVLACFDQEIFDAAEVGQKFWPVPYIAREREAAWRAGADVRAAANGYAEAKLPGNDVGHHVPEADKPGRYEDEHPDVLPKVAFVKGGFSSHVLKQSPVL